MVLRAENDAPSQGTDPLAQWRVDLHLRREGAVLSGPSPAALAPALRRYLAIHARRAALRPLPPFWSDALRQADLEPLGITAHPPHQRLNEEELGTACGLWRLLRARGFDEPLLERWLLHQIGFTGTTLALGFWLEVLAARSHDGFALERTRYGLAALALMAGLHRHHASFAALREALALPEPTARIEAALYLLGAYRLEGRAAPLDAVQALERLARHDPVLGTRFVARQLLASERLALGPEPATGALELFVRSRIEPERALRVALKCTRTLADLHHAVQLRAGGAMGHSYGFVLDAELRLPRCVVLAQGTPQGAAELMLCELGLRARDRFEYWFVREHLRRTWVEVAALGEAVSEAPPRSTAPWLLFRSPVHGTRFHDGPALTEPVPTGTVLSLVREGDNGFDDRAVEVRLLDGRKLGYVPRTRNRALAARMDEGDAVFGLLERFEGPREAPEIELGIYVGSAPMQRAG